MKQSEKAKCDNTSVVRGEGAADLIHAGWSNSGLKTLGFTTRESVGALVRVHLSLGNLGDLQGFDGLNQGLD